MEVNDREKKLLQYIHTLKDGEITIVVYEGQPVRIEEVNTTPVEL